jgi:hypothetical protein
VGLSSATVTQAAVKYEWMKPVRTAKLQPGINYRYYEPAGKIDMSVVEKMTATGSGITGNISLAEKKRKDKFAFVFEGYIRIEKDGVFHFYIASDDGSRLFIDDIQVVDNDGDHGTVEKSGRMALKKGYHKIKVVYFDSGGGNELKLSMQPRDGKKEEIPGTILYH